MNYETKQNLESNLLKECCVCQSIYDTNRQEWYFPPMSVRKVEEAKYDGITSGYCPPCLYKEKEKILATMPRPFGTVTQEHLEDEVNKAFDKLMEEDQ